MEYIWVFSTVFKYIYYIVKLVIWSTYIWNYIKMYGNEWGGCIIDFNKTWFGRNNTQTYCLIVCRSGSTVTINFVRPSFCPVITCAIMRFVHCGHSAWEREVLWKLSKALFPEMVCIPFKSSKDAFTECYIQNDQLSTSLLTTLLQKALQMSFYFRS